MTVCIAATNGEETWIGHDGRQTAGGSIVSDCAVKCFSAGDWIVLHAGQGRARDLVSAQAETIFAPEDPVEIGTAIMNVLGSDGFESSAKGEGAKCFDQWWLLVRRAAIFAIAGDGAVIRPGSMFSIGSGSSEATAVFIAARRFGQSIETAITAALEITVSLDHGCGGDLVIRRVWPAA